MIDIKSGRKYWTGGKYIKGYKLPSEIERKRIESLKKRGKPKNFKEMQEKAWKANRKPWNKLTYGARHKRIREEKRNVKNCTICGKDGLGKQFMVWANTNHQYRHKAEEWIKICRSCHIEWDKKNNDIKYGRKRVWDKEKVFKKTKEILKANPNIARDKIMFNEYGIGGRTIERYLKNRWKEIKMIFND